MVKSTKYAAQGVAHYWIVDLEHRAVDVFVLDDGTYSLERRVTAGMTELVDFSAGQLTLDLSALLA